DASSASARMGRGASARQATWADDTIPELPMAQLLTLHQPCRLDLECPDGIPAPGPAVDCLLKYMFSVRGKAVLEVGCGCGLFAIAAAKLGASEVWATDPSPDAIQSTRINAE